MATVTKRLPGEDQYYVTLGNRDEYRISIATAPGCMNYFHVYYGAERVNTSNTFGDPMGGKFGAEPEQVTEFARGLLALVGEKE